MFGYNDNFRLTATNTINKDGKITGIDISQGMLNVAKRKFDKLNNVKFKLLDVENEFIRIFEALTRQQ